MTTPRDTTGYQQPDSSTPQELHDASISAHRQGEQCDRHDHLESSSQWLVPTPPSLKGSQYGTRSRPHSPCMLDAGNLSGSETATYHTPYAQTMDDLRILLKKAVKANDSSRALQEILTTWEDQVVQVHEELLDVTKKMHRERRKYSLRVMEKECHAKRLAVESESLRGIIEATSASLDALKLHHGHEKRVLQERVQSLEIEIEKTLERQHHTLKTFEDAGINPETAAEQLVDAYSENARLEEHIEELQIDLEKATRYSESQDTYYQSKIAELYREIGELQNATNRAATPPSRRYSSPQSHHSGSGIYSNPLHGEVYGEGGSVCSYGTNDEDILAAEVTNLRMKTKDLESQASAASDTARLASTLEKEASTLRAENARLREMVTASMSEASDAKVEVAKLTSEANVLHAQLAEVISAMNIEQQQSVSASDLPEEEQHMHQKEGPLTPSSLQGYHDPIDRHVRTDTADTETSADIRMLFHKAIQSVDSASQMVVGGYEDGDVFT